MFPLPEEGGAWEHPPGSVYPTLLRDPGAKLSGRHFHSRVKAFLINCWQPHWWPPGDMVREGRGGREAFNPSEMGK